MQSMVLLTVLITTIYLMAKTKNKVAEGQISEEGLTGKEKLLIWILCFLNPIIAGAIFYYGWKKKLPNKAHQANQISLWAFFIAMILALVFIFLISSKGPIYEPDNAKIYIHERLTLEDSKRLTEGDILDIIEAEFRYIQDKGVLDEKGIEYIQNEGMKSGKSYSAEDINKIIDIEEDYMKSIGIEVQEVK